VVHVGPVSAAEFGQQPNKLSYAEESGQLFASLDRMNSIAVFVETCVAYTWMEKYLWYLIATVFQKLETFQG